MGIAARRRAQVLGGDASYGGNRGRSSTHARTHAQTHCVYNTPDALFLVQAAKETLELIAAVCTFVQGALYMDKPPLHTTALLDTLGVLHGRRMKLSEEATLVFKFNY